MIASAVEQRVRQHDVHEPISDERPIWEVIGDIMKDVPEAARAVRGRFRGANKHRRR